MSRLFELWEQLGNVPVNDDGCIQKPFELFLKDTHREDVWHWMEKTFDASIHDMMFGAKLARVDAD